jgi:hypothetical protein
MIVEDQGESEGESDEEDASEYIDEADSNYEEEGERPDDSDGDEEEDEEEIAVKARGIPDGLGDERYQETPPYSALYVGYSVSPRTRFKQHASRTPILFGTSWKRVSLRKLFLIEMGRIHGRAA